MVLTPNKPILPQPSANRLPAYASAPARPLPPMQQSDTEFLAWARLEQERRCETAIVQAQAKYSLCLLPGRAACQGRRDSYGLVNVKTGERTRIHAARVGPGLPFEFRVLCADTWESYGDQGVLDAWNSRLSRLGARFRIYPKHYYIREMLLNALFDNVADNAVAAGTDGRR